MAIAAIVLAAGTSSRMGRPKVLLELGGKSLVRRAAERALGAAGVERVVVVAGAHRAEMEHELAGLPVEIAYNPAYATGMASSLRAGLEALGPETEAVIIMLADQPYQHSQVVERLIEAYRQSGRPIVAPRYGEQRGNPVLFDRRLFPELAILEGDAGARELLKRRGDEVELVPFDAAWLHDDLDTLDDYERARASFGGPHV